MSSGSPPRVRRAPEQVSDDLALVWITPVCTGNASISSTSDGTRSDHPRAYEEPCGFQDSGGLGRIAPRVGEHYSAAVNSARWTDHPRAYGEHHRRDDHPAQPGWITSARRGSTAASSTTS